MSEINVARIEGITAGETYDLIDHYRENRLLWDTTNKNYKNSTAKLHSLMNLADLLTEKRGGKFPVQVSEIQKKWDGLRAQYNREKKRRAKVTGPGRDDMKQWVYYEALTFLDANEDNLESQQKMCSILTSSSKRNERNDFEEDDVYSLSSDVSYQQLLLRTNKTDENTAPMKDFVSPTQTLKAKKMTPTSCRKRAASSHYDENFEHMLINAVSRDDVEPFCIKYAYININMYIIKFSKKCKRRLQEVG